MTDAMEVEDAPVEATTGGEGEEEMPIVVEEEDEEDVKDLTDWIEDAESKQGNAAIPVFHEVIGSEKDGAKALQIKEKAVYGLVRAFCATDQHTQIVTFLETSPFFKAVTKAKCAKIVRQMLDIVSSLAPKQFKMQEDLCQSIIQWCTVEKRSFLRQRVQAKLASIWYAQEKYSDALALIDDLLRELKQLDDKQLLVETHLQESKIHFALRNLPKAKAALTASRTAANAIYVTPTLQADMDTLSGTLHTEESDYNTGHSYFLEAFEQLDQMNAPEEAITPLKYMMLCKILDALTKALKQRVDITKETVLDVSSLITNKQAVKYAGKDLEALQAIAKAASKRSWKDLEATLDTYSKELREDLLIQHHLKILQEQMLESNLLRILEPYECVELAHVAELMELPLPMVERKLSQMILDGKFQGILDQGKGQLIVYEPSTSDKAMEQGLQVLENLDQVVTTLFDRSKALRTLVL
eukprot:CAMPEP_0119546182 /NCGR_PEP_ID=MMETSP1352-20130426/702_1 /TAXON_ID=265584 /ORGANISM="Stauroneis constricta, Strain CCMP1120" /LENGTH=469 /DNA_ID=CAMNT_0007590849 /DNA_START=67 /DNA_END=1476 /DNA_ORIENTATION=+